MNIFWTNKIIIFLCLKYFEKNLRKIVLKYLRHILEKIQSKLLFVKKKISPKKGKKIRKTFEFFFYFYFLVEKQKFSSRDSVSRNINDLAQKQF